MRGAPVTIVGSRAPSACPLVLVAEGDVQAGDPVTPLAFRGALVVCGRLTVSGDTTVQGAVFAGSLAVQAPLALAVASDWRSHPLAGLTTPVIVGLARDE